MRSVARSIARAAPAPPPAAWQPPLIGETIAFGRDARTFVAERRDRFGPIFDSVVLGRRMTFLVGAEALRFALQTHRDCFVSGPGWPKGLQLLMGGSLMMLDGAPHDRARRLLGRAFSGAAVAGYVPTIETTARAYLARWAEARQVALYDAVKQLTFDVAAQAILGAAPGAEVERLGRLFSDYTRGMEGVHPLLRVPLPFTPFGRAVRARRQLLEHVDRSAQARRGTPGRDALSLLAQLDERDCSAAELAEHALFLLFAGHESTTSLIASACLELARDPALLARARAERDALGDGPLALRALDELPILEALLTEVERLYPPFLGSFRQSVRPFTFGGFAVPAGRAVFVAINATHLDPGVFACPHQFDVERWRDPETAPARRRELELAGFGGGPRTCLGMGFARAEAKVVLALLLRGYAWTLDPTQRLDLVYLPSLSPKERLRVTLTRRSGVA